MSDLIPEPMQAKLAEYIDGRATDATRQEVEAFLKPRPDLRRTVLRAMQDRSTLISFESLAAPAELEEFLQSRLEREALLRDAASPMKRRSPLPLAAAAAVIVLIGGLGVIIYQSLPHSQSLALDTAAKTAEPDPRGAGDVRPQTARSGSLMDAIVAVPSSRPIDGPAALIDAPPTPRLAVPLPPPDHFITPSIGADPAPELEKPKSSDAVADNGAQNAVVVVLPQRGGRDNQMLQNQVKQRQVADNALNRANAMRRERSSNSDEHTSQLPANAMQVDLAQNYKDFDASLEAARGFASQDDKRNDTAWENAAREAMPGSNNASLGKKAQDLAPPRVLMVDDMVSFTLVDPDASNLRTQKVLQLNLEGRVDLPGIASVKIEGLDLLSAAKAIESAYREAGVMQNARVEMSRAPAAPTSQPSTLTLGEPIEVRLEGAMAQIVRGRVDANGNLSAGPLESIPAFGNSAASVAANIAAQIVPTTQPSSEAAQLVAVRRLRSPEQGDAEMLILSVNSQSPTTLPTTAPTTTQPSTLPAATTPATLPATQAS